jgi:gamma-glutamylcyclotransferase
MINKDSSKIWYFAYGSNLSKAQMLARTGFVGDVKICRLKNYRFIFNKRSFRVPGRVFANILPSPGDDVWGVAYACTQDMINTLDEYEYVHQENYMHHHIQVTTTEDETLSALTYVAGANFICKEGKPSVDYVSLILNGAKFYGLPDFYIENIVSQVNF